MIIRKNTILLDDHAGFSPTREGVTYVDKTGVSIYVPLKLLVSLYEGTKFDMERRGIDWEQLTNNLFMQQSEK